MADLSLSLARVERDTLAFFLPYRSTSEVRRPISEAKRLMSFGVWDRAT